MELVKAARDGKVHVKIIHGVESLCGERTEIVRPSTCTISGVESIGASTARRPSRMRI